MNNYWNPFPNKGKSNAEQIFENMDWQDRNLLQQMEPMIAQSAAFSYLYAFHVLKTRFYYGEQAIADDPHYSLLYSIHIIGGRWFEGESSMSMDSEIALEYSYLIQQPFELGEEAISMNSFCSKHYADEILHDRFRLGEENSLFLTPSTAVDYCLRWGKIDEAEEIISRCGQSSYTYASCVINTRFKLGEEAIGTVGSLSLQYCKDFIGARFPEGEEIISKSYELSTEYAITIGEPFKLGEQTIATNAEYSLIYARFLRNRFPEGEPTIMACQYTKKTYRSFLQSLNRE